MNPHKIIDEVRQNRNIYIFSDIGEKTAENVITAINNFNTDDDDYESDLKDFNRQMNPIKIHINSYGGYLYDGLAIFDCISRSKTPIEIIAQGKIMSMAFGIFFAVPINRRYVTKRATFMYHEVMNGAYGSLTSIKETVVETERLQAIYDEIVLSNSKITVEILNDVKERKSELMIPPAKAVELGIVLEGNII